MEFVKDMDLVSFQSLAESSERVWKSQARFTVRRQMVSPQGTGKAFKNLMKELEP